MNKQEFEIEIQKIGIKYTEENLKQLEIYKEVLVEYNQHTNVTAIKDEKGIYLKHFYDSLTLQKYIKENTKVLDIGTGAGFPGFVLAIFNPNTNFILLDSNNKKIKFLKTLQEKLHLKNVELIEDRAENYVRKNLEQFDVVTSRAVASLRILAELSIPALKINGYFIPLKANIEDEIKECEETLEVLNGKILEKKEFVLPFEKSKRTILIIEHFTHTDKDYPRIYDKILKKPLKKVFK